MILFLKLLGMPFAQSECSVGRICIIRCMEQGIQVVLTLNFILMILRVQRRGKTSSQCVIKCMEQEVLHQLRPN